jgi:hypothetical protein
VSEDSTGKSAELQLPVLDSTLPEYQSYMPATPGSGTASREHHRPFRDRVPQPLPQPVARSPAPVA